GKAREGDGTRHQGNEEAGDQPSPGRDQPGGDKDGEDHGPDRQAQVQEPGREKGGPGEQVDEAEGSRIADGPERCWRSPGHAIVVPGGERACEIVVVAGVVEETFSGMDGG